jgi:hypothetical protein
MKLTKLLPLGLFVLVSFGVLSNSVNAQTLDYGSVKIGETKTLQASAFCPADSGGSCLTIGQLAITGTNASEFKITNDGCSGVTLPGQGSCTVDVVFTPQSPAGPKEAFLPFVGTQSEVFFTYTLKGIAEGGPLKIIKPTSDQIFTLKAPNFTKTDAITFQAEVAAPNENNLVDWNVKLEYATSGGRGAAEDTRTFQTQAPTSVSHDETYTARGGKITVNASTAISGKTENASPGTAFIVGVSIPDQQITDRLVSIYHGATPKLLTGIAQRESSYQQFKVITLYGISARWPHESFDGGSHIGLMQVETTMRHAWDWEDNSRDAANLFQDKLAAARRIMQRIINDHKGLRKLTDLELENMALVLYGPEASADRAKQYYTPVDVGNGKFDWVVNTAGNPAGVNYANSIRALMK